MDHEIQQKIVKYLNKLKYGNGERDIYLKKLEYYLMEGGVLESMMEGMNASFQSIDRITNAYNINDIKYNFNGNNISVGDIQQFGEYYNKLNDNDKQKISRCLLNPSDSDYNINVCTSLFTDDKENKENNNININRNVFNLIQTYMLRKQKDIPDEIKNEILMIYKNITGEEKCLGFACN